MRKAILVAALLLVACGSRPSNEELQDRVAELEDENAGLRETLDASHAEAAEALSAVEAVQSAAQETHTESERFGFEDWRGVVGDVQFKAQTTVSAADEAYAAASEAAEAPTY